jgi:hypothetical protein
MANVLDSSALARWRANPVSFIQQVLQNPESRKPFELLGAELVFLQHGPAGSPSSVVISRPIRRMWSGCCARAASGHVAVAPPMSVMNSRRCSGRDVRFIARPPHRTVRAAFPHTAPTSGV